MPNTPTNMIELLETRCQHFQTALHAASFREAQLRTQIRDLIFQIQDQNSNTAPAEDGVTADVDKAIDHLINHRVRGQKLGDLGDAVDREKRNEKASGAIGRTTQRQPYGSF